MPKMLGKAIKESWALNLWILLIIFSVTVQKQVPKAKDHAPFSLRINLER